MFSLMESVLLPVGGQLECRQMQALCGICDLLCSGLGCSVTSCKPDSSKCSLTAIMGQAMRASGCCCMCKQLQWVGWSADCVDTGALLHA